MAGCWWAAPTRWTFWASTRIVVDMLHVKDFVRDPSQTLGFRSVDVGQGLIDWRPVLTAARKQGVKYLYVEQEAPYVRPVFDSLATARDVSHQPLNARSLKLVGVVELRPHRSAVYRLALIHGPIDSHNRQSRFEGFGGGHREGPLTLQRRFEVAGHRLIGAVVIVLGAFAIVDARGLPWSIARRIMSRLRTRSAISAPSVPATYQRRSCNAV